MLDEEQVKDLLNTGSEIEAKNLRGASIMEPSATPSLVEANKEQISKEATEIDEALNIGAQEKSFSRPKLSYDAIDLGQYTILGGTFHFELLQLPQQPKFGRNWNIVTLCRPLLMKRINLDNFGESAPISVSETTAAQVTEESTKENAPELKEPFKISVKISISSDICLSENAVLACWDKNTLEWRTSGLHITKIENKATNSIKFETSVFGIMGVFQEMYTAFPYQSWELYPLKPFNSRKANSTKAVNGGEVPFNHLSASNRLGLDEETYFAYLKDGAKQAVLKINTASFTIKLHVLGERIRIMQDESDHFALINEPEPTGNDLLEEEGETTEQDKQHVVQLCSQLKDRWLELEELEKALKMSGMNIFPREDAASFVEPSKKVGYNLISFSLPIEQIHRKTIL
ncbi:Protein casc1 [Cichlidogyrus casuarinus]|uniref:Protein casc1 n=1 Tax=Cichlidogyrus casuarinus TaxID=1844966 RepID=A0ABD2PMP8_9PLAT